MAKEFYYQVMGEVVGPVSGVELRQKAVEQTVTQDTLVRVGGDGTWVPANRLKGLFDEHGNPLPHLAPEPDTRKHKTCPYCAESILATAIKCRYCGEFLETDGPAPTPDSAAKPPDGSRLRSCPDCGHQVSKHAPQCPGCGRPFERPLEHMTTPPAPANREGEGPAKVKPGNEVTDNVRVALAFLTAICWGLVLLIFASDPDEHALWFVPLLIAAVVCAILGGVIGSFKNAGDIGGMLGATFGPLGVIGVLAIDGRPQCPKCGGRLDGTPEVCPHCHVRLVFPTAVEQRAEPVPQCPQCSGSIVGHPSRCAHCSSIVHWVDGRPLTLGQYQLAEACRKFSADLLELLDSQGPIAVCIDTMDCNEASHALDKLGFAKQDPPSFIMRLLFGQLRGYIDASKLRELAVLRSVARVRRL